VERALRRQGWRFLARRLKTALGEIDLLFAERGTLVVVEVKTGRAGTRFRPGQRLGHEQLARLWSAARALARGAPCRVDLVEVLQEDAGGVRRVHWPDLREPLP